MSGTLRRRLQSALARSFTIVCLVALVPFASLAQSGDEAALRQLVERFFASYQNRDLNALLVLWSDKSPNRAAAKQYFEQIFGENKLELKNLTFRKISIGDRKANVRIVAELSGVDAKTGNTASGFGKVNKTLDSVKESEGWKVWRYAPSEDDLADALVSATTDEERKAKLSAEQDMVTDDLVQAVLAHGERFSRQNNYPRALAVYELGVDLATRVGDKSRLAGALRGAGTANQVLGNYNKGLDYCKKSVVLAEEVGDKNQIALGLNNIGLIYQQQGDNTRSLEHYHRALKIRREMDDKAGMAPILTNIGSVHRALGNHAEALEYYQNNLKLLEELGDRPSSAPTLMNIGILYNSEGNRTQALEYYQRGLKIKEEMGDKSGIANVLYTIGLLHAQQSNFTQALEYFQKSLRTAEETGSKLLLGRAMGSLGGVYHSLGDFSRALEYYQRALKIAEEMGASYFIAANLFNTGLIHYSQGNPALALEHYQRALKIGEQMRDQDGIATALAAISDVHLDRGEFSQAVDLVTRGIAIARQSGALLPLSELHIVGGKAYRGLNKPEEARRSFAAAIAAVEEMRSNVAGGTQQEQQFFEHQLEAYYCTVDLLIGQGNLTDAFAYAERAKARALLDTLQSGRVNITRAMTTTEQDEERSVNGEVNSLNIQTTREKVRRQPDQARLAELDARLTRARLDQERFQVNLYAAHPELKARRGRMQPISLEQAGGLIPDAETAVLEYMIAKNKSQLFVLTKAPGVKGEPSPPTPILKVYTINIKEKDLAGRVEKFRSRLANQDFLVHEPARELYDLLLGPARAELQNKTNLIIVPDGVLWELPFQALQPAPKRYLIENSAISYAPSFTVLLEMTRSHSAAINSPKLLALGNPAIGKQTAKRISSVQMDGRLDPLPEAERQVKELAKLYGPSRSKIYIGADAQEARVKTEAAGYGILHLAAHGILNDKNPMYSQVVLSQPEGDTTEDGMLEAWEVMKLDLKADLVVLSACDTARGKVGSGEGMVGLAWAFFVAGVPTTVASQWSVEAASTTELMVEFHRNLERHKGKAESLRQAMLKLLKSKEYGRPFYWAGFVVVGNGR